MLLGLLIPVKGLLFFGLLLRFRLRARTSFLSALSLSNFSEFGLIVAAIGVANGWLSETWLITLAIALSISFVLAAPLNGRSHRLYERYRGRLRRLQGLQRIPEEAEIVPGEPRVLVLGMGRVGVGAYDEMVRKTRELVVGVDLDVRTVERNLAEGRQVIRGSAVDPDFWSRLHLDHSRVRLVLLAMPRLAENVLAAEQLRKYGYSGPIGAIAKYPDEVAKLEAAGVEMVFNLYAEAGAGFAEHVSQTRPEGLELAG
jgi:hypothetical protein